MQHRLFQFLVLYKLPPYIYLLHGLKGCHPILIFQKRKEKKRGLVPFRPHLRSYICQFFSYRYKCIYKHYSYIYIYISNIIQLAIILDITYVSEKNAFLSILTLSCILYFCFILLPEFVQEQVALVIYSCLPYPFSFSAMQCHLF